MAGALVLLWVAVSLFLGRVDREARKDYLNRIESRLYEHQHSNLEFYFRGKMGMEESEASRRADEAWEAMDMNAESLLEMMEEAED